MVDVEQLSKRRAAVVARHEVLESVPGSGWHPDDAQARDEARGGMSPVSKRPVALQGDGVAYFVGPDVPLVRERLASFAKKHADADGPAQLTHAAAVCSRVAAGEGDDVIELPSRDFNAALYALGDLKVTVVVTGVAA